MDFDMLIMNIIKGLAPCVVGLDVGVDELPAEFKDMEPAKAVKAYNRAVIDVVCQKIPAISINVPALLPYGISTVADTAAYAKEKGMYVIADAKCSGEPVAAKAEAELYFDIIGVDCVTVSAYYGAAGLAPFFERCKKDKKSVFVVAHSESGTPQDLQELMAGLRMVYRAVCEKVVMWGGGRAGEMGYSDIGIMLGGVSNANLADMRRAYKETLFLLTGYDGKKTTAHDLNGAFDMRGLGGLVYVNRYITLPSGDGDFSERVAKRTEEVCRDLKLCF